MLDFSFLYERLFFIYNARFVLYSLSPCNSRHSCRCIERFTCGICLRDELFESTRDTNRDCLWSGHALEDGTSDLWSVEVRIRKCISGTVRMGTWSRLWMDTTDLWRWSRGTLPTRLCLPLPATTTLCGCKFHYMFFSLLLSEYLDGSAFQKWSIYVAVWYFCVVLVFIACE